MSRTLRLLAIVAAVSACVAGAGLLWDRVETNPDIRLLRAHDGVAWIKFPESTSLRIHHLGDYQTSFRSTFQVDSVPAEAWLELRALADAKVYVNDMLALDRLADRDRWKTPRTVDIAPMLREGENHLRAEAYTTNGPRLFWLRCASLGIATDETWLVSHDGDDWVSASDARRIEPSTLSKQFPKPGKALLRTLPILLSIFIVVFAYQWLPQTHPVVTRLRPWLKASRVRWYVMGAWALLAANNIFKVPLITGFDIEGHINYIHFIASRGRLPLADDGWQMFQSPLYYVVSAVSYWFLSKSMELDDVMQWLRVIPLACGMAQAEVAYRVVRRVFPERNDLQVVGTVFAAFLPMNVYISQYIGNEPMAGLLSALVCLQCVRILTMEHPTPRQTFGLSVLLSLAILTKVTAVLLIPPCAGVLIYISNKQKKHRARRLALNTFIPTATLGVLCGWYFVRNYLHFGQMFVGGWEVARNIVWWQDPGYRTPEQFLRFGEALLRPVSAGTQGIWDAFYSTFWLDGLLSSIVDYAYRPPWNYDFMIAGAWLALVPALLIVTGAIRGASRWKTVDGPAWLFALGCCAMYLAAFAWLYLSLPVYSTGKATYTLGLAPLYSLLLVSGLNGAAGSFMIGAAARAWTAVWIIAVLWAYVAA